MKDAGLTPSDIKSLDDLHKLPFITKDDLRETYPYGLFARPLKDCVRIHSTSGTTGRRVVAGYTQHDIDLWNDCTSRALVAAGATKDDVVQVCYGYGLFTGGAGLDGGSHKVGCLTIPMSSGNTSRQLQFMTDLGSTIICCTPSYAMFLGEAMRECEWSRDEFKLKVGVFGAEPWTEKMRVKLEESLGIKAYDIYGLSEISGPGVGYECEHQCGTHLNEDYFYPEILDPNTGEPLPEGQFGELTFTHLTKEGMQLLRYRTHDLTALHYDKCACGRTLVRMDRILGRCDDMLIIRGVNVFPSQIEDVILKLPEYEPHFLLTVDRVNNTDTSELKVEVKEEYFTDDMATMVGLQKKLEAELRSVIGLGFKVKLVEPKGIERSEGKAKRVIDKRQL
jgi:phenylacetate-CoA ligase